MSCILLSRDIGGVFIDVVVSEQHTSEMEIAKHPIERGAEVSDHAWRKGRAVVIEGVVAESRAFDAFSRLHALQDKQALFTLVTGLKVYQNMLCKSIEAERSEDYSRVLKFSASCEEIILVDTQTSRGSGSSAGAGKGNATAGKSSDVRASTTVNRGSVPASPASAPTTESFFKSIQA